MSTILRFDPTLDQFKADLHQIPGYPAGEALPIRKMVFEPEAISRLPELLALAGAEPEHPLLVVMDRWPIKRREIDLKPQLLSNLRQAGWQPEAVWLEPDSGAQLHTDLVQIGKVKGHLSPGTAVLSLGSGTVTDIAKHACYLYQQEQRDHPVPFVVCPTANSVSAYTSNTASVLVEGVKRTLPSRYPDVLVYDLEMLRSAPTATAVAGAGDVLVAFGSFADWYLGYRLGLDPTYTGLPQTLIGDLDQLLLAHAADIRESTLTGVEVLAKVLALEGLATSLAHTTAPFSGFEHAISHLLDLMAEHAGRPVAQHGTQVVLLTILTTEAYRIFMAEFNPDELNLADCYPTVAQMQERVQAAFEPLDPSGRVAAECWSEYRQKLDQWQSHRRDFEEFLRDWPAVRARLDSLVRPPELLVKILREIDAPLHFDELNPAINEDQLRFAFFNAPFIRRRFSLGDLLLFLNWDSTRLWQQVWATSQRLRRVAG
jgi:glycerol-1-phosphate dehydrogenase [NAD(P)+]